MKRLVVGVAIAVAAVAIVVVIITVVAGRDAGDVNGTTGPGVLERTSPAGQVPTSGSQRGASIARDGGELTDEQVVSALALGNVVLAYDGDKAALAKLQSDTAGPYSPDLAAAGQAVILDRRPGIKGVQALAWQRRLTVPSASDPQLGAFIDAWLGQSSA